MSVDRARIGVLNVFISYSRDDISFADQLIAALALTNCATTIDRQGIFGGEDWKVRLGNLIRDSDVVVFVLSPSSARSPVCAWEAKEATRLGKRIIPVLCRPLDDVPAPTDLTDLNFIYFYSDPKVSGSGFGTGQVQLVAALRTDIDWIRSHTRLLQSAMEWQEASNSTRRLLFGENVGEALQWVARKPASTPELSPLLRDFIRASEEEENRRSGAEARHRDEVAALQSARVRAESQRDGDRQRSARQVRRLAALMIAGFCTALLFAALAGSLGVLVLQKRQQIEAERVTALKELTGASNDQGTLPDDGDKVGAGDGPGAMPAGIGFAVK